MILAKQQFVPNNVWKNDQENDPKTLAKNQSIMKKYRPQTEWNIVVWHKESCT